MLSRDEVYRMTKYRRPSRQIEWLRDNGYKFYIAADGHPSVLSHKPQFDSTKSRDGLLTHDEVIRRAKQVSRRKICGIYFLVNGSTVIYVGKSTNVLRRVLEHIVAGDKEFDAYHVISANRTKLDGMERAYIKAFTPGCNVQRNWK